MKHAVHIALAVAIALHSPPSWAQDCRDGAETTVVKCSTAQTCAKKVRAFDELAATCKRVESERDTNAAALRTSEAARGIVQRQLAITQEALTRSQEQREGLQAQIDAQPHPAVVAVVSVAVGLAVGYLLVSAFAHGE